MHCTILLPIRPGSPCDVARPGRSDLHVTAEGPGLRCPCAPSRHLWGFAAVALPSSSQRQDACKLVQMGMELMPSDGDAAVTAPAGGADLRWAKGVQSGARRKRRAVHLGGLRIRGKRHALTLRCSQAEAAVGYDLAGFWSHRAKGNNPQACTRYNFALVWYPRRLLDELLALQCWEAVKSHLAQLAASGGLRRLVPFDGFRRRYAISDAKSWRPPPGLELCINARGIHFFRGSWSCVPMEEVESFGSSVSGCLLTLAYTLPGGRPGCPGATSAIFRCRDATHAYRELQAAAAQRRAAGLRVPRDLGAEVPLSLSGAGAARELKRPLALGVLGGEKSAGEEEGESYSEEEERQGSGAYGDDSTCNPSLEELELFAGFAGMACSGSGLSRGGSGTRSGTGSGTRSGTGSGGTGSGASNSGGEAPSAAAAERHGGQPASLEAGAGVGATGCSGVMKPEQGEEAQAQPSAGCSALMAPVAAVDLEGCALKMCRTAAATAAAMVKAKPEPETTAGPEAEPAACSAPPPSHSPTGSTSSSRAGGKAPNPGPAGSPARAARGSAASTQLGTSTRKRRSPREPRGAKQQQQQQAEEEDEGEEQPREGKRARSQQQRPAGATPLTPAAPGRVSQQAQLPPTPQQLHQRMQMLQMMQMGCMSMPMPQMVPVAIAAAMQQHHQAATAAVAASQVQGTPAGASAPAGAIPCCFPYQHSGMASMAMVPMMAPVMIHPGVAAAMQAQAAAAAHQMQATAGSHGSTAVVSATASPAAGRMPFVVPMMAAPAGGTVTGTSRPSPWFSAFLATGAHR